MYLETLDKRDSRLHRTNRAEIAPFGVSRFVRAVSKCVNIVASNPRNSK